MILKCKRCGEEFGVKQDYFYHAGHSDVGFLYCNRCPNILLFNIYDKYYSGLFREKLPWDLKKIEKEKIEKELVLCPCGGKFLFRNKPRCPHCNGSIQNLLPGKIYYVVLGEVIDGGKENVWKKLKKSEKRKR